MPFTLQMIHVSITCYACQAQDKDEPSWIEVLSLLGNLANLFQAPSRPTALAALARRSLPVRQAPDRGASSSQRGFITVPSRELSSKLKGATSFRGLLLLCAAHQANFDEIHISVVWYKISKLSKPTTWKRAMFDSGFLETTIRLLLESGPRTVSTIAHSAVKATFSSSRLFDALAEQCQKRLEEFNPLDFANIVWAFAKTDYRAPELFEAVAEKIEERLDNFSDRQVTNIVWAFSTLDCKAPKLFKAVAEKAKERLKEFVPQAFANMVWAFAKLGLRAPEFFDAVAEKAAERLEEFNPQDLANTVWAFAKLDHEAPKLFEAVAEKAEERLDAFQPRNFANVVWAFATLDHEAPKLFEEVAQKAGKHLTNFKPQELANTVWAFATLGYEAPKLFDAVEEIAEERLEVLNPQAFANMVWAFANLDYRALSLFEGVAEKATERVDACKPQELANVVWAFAKVDHRASKLFDTVAEKVHECVKDFSQRDIASIVWAFAKLEHRAPKLFDAVAKEADESLRDFHPQHLANTVWAFAAIDFRAPKLLKAVAEKAEERLDDFNLQDLANTAWAFSTLYFRAPKLLEAVAEKAEQRLEEFNPREFSNIVWAFAKVDCRTPTLLEAVAEKAEVSLEEFKPQDLANMLWAFATLDSTAPKLFEVLVEKAAERLEEFLPQHLANMVWAFAKLGYRAHALFEVVLERIEGCWDVFNSQELANSVWAFAKLDYRAPKISEAVESQVLPRLSSFGQADFTALLWALSQNYAMTAACDILAGAITATDLSITSGALKMYSFSSLLMECEQNGWLDKEVEILTTMLNSGGAVDELAQPLGTAITNALTTRLLAMGRKEEAKKILLDAAHHGSVDCLSEILLIACGGYISSENFPAADMNQILPASKIQYCKELRLLAFVLSEARFNDPVSVCDAMERFGKDVLSVEGRWLKLAGESKTDVLEVGIRHSPEKGYVLEIGTYCGYSALRMASAKSGTRVISLEVEPVHMVIARNVVAFAGMSHSINIWTGHSKDVVPRLPRTCSEDIALTFGTVFLDNRGSGFDEDLQTLEDMRLLEPSAVVIADNVLKPGAPSFLWRLCKSDAYTTQIISLQEFASNQEDWMSASVRKHDESVDVSAHPLEILQMQWESDRIRALSMELGEGVADEKWISYSENMGRRLATLGIEATACGSGLCPLGLCHE